MTGENKDTPSYCFMIWLQLKNYICDYEGCKNFLLLLAKGRQIRVYWKLNHKGNDAYLWDVLLWGICFLKFLKRFVYPDFLQEHLLFLRIKKSILF